MFFLKKIKYLLLIVLFFIFLLITFFAVDNSLRRSVISKILVLHDIYRVRSLTHGLQIRDFKLLSEKLDRYIEVSNKFSRGRTYMFPGIYEATELVVSRAMTQNDYNQIQDVLKKLLNFDNRVYKLHVWYARALRDDDLEEALKHIDTAIQISPSEEDAYREALNITQINMNLELANLYCKKFKKEFLGGSKPLHFSTIFDSFNNQKFSLNINSNNFEDLNLINSNFVLNQQKIYEFILKNPKNLDGISLYFAPLNDLSLKIDFIEYFSHGQRYLIDSSNLSVISNHSSILQDSEKSFEILLSKKKEDLLRFKHKRLENIDKINISMSLKKMNLTNNNLCTIK